MNTRKSIWVDFGMHKLVKCLKGRKLTYSFPRFLRIGFNLWNCNIVLLKQTELLHFVQWVTLLRLKIYHYFKVPNSLTLSWMSWGRSLRLAIVCKDFSSLTPLEVALVLAWEHFLSPRSERSTPTESWTLTPLCLRPRFPTLLLSPTMPPCPSTSWLRTLTRPSALTMKPFMTSASGHWSSAPQPMEISTIWFPWSCQVSPPAFASLASSTLTWESWLSTWCRSLVSTFSCPVSPLWPLVVASSTGLWPSQVNHCRFILHKSGLDDYFCT